jgi:hypothetical protein
MITKKKNMFIKEKLKDDIRYNNKLLVVIHPQRPHEVKEGQDPFVSHWYKLNEVEDGEGLYMYDSGYDYNITCLDETMEHISVNCRGDFSLVIVK